MKLADYRSFSKWFGPRAYRDISRGHSLLNGHDGRQALRFDFFEPIIMLFNLNETPIKKTFGTKAESCQKLGFDHTLFG